MRESKGTNNYGLNSVTAQYPKVFNVPAIKFGVNESADNTFHFSGDIHRQNNIQKLSKTFSNSHYINQQIH